MTDVNKTQIIDYDGHIIDNLKEWMNNNKLSKLGFNYNVIAILGSQSSGKSTLLNNLFKTSFDVMNTKLGHSQTTQGLWLSYDKFEDELTDASNEETDVEPQNKSNNKHVINPTLILDVEGNDSKERGENRLTFEHRSALFSLALADCVIVNLWYHSLGNFTASNYGLLKTVMEVHLELFHQNVNCPKTILLFTVRDWFEEFAPLDIIREKIVDEYVNKIWCELKKSENSKNANIDDYFIIEVVGLSHGIIKKDEFLKDIKRLRHKWIYELRPINYSRNIPADGFAQYCNNIWNTIIKQSQLDIPSQQEMLATFRCQEIKNNVLNHISNTIKEKMVDSKNKYIENFKTWAEKDIIEKSLNEYLTDAARYQKIICLKTLEELLENLFIQLQIIVDNNLNFTQRILSSKFSKELNSMYSICTTDKSYFLFINDQNVDVTEQDENLSNVENIGENSKKGNQIKCINLWSNFLYNADMLEYTTIANFFDQYKKCSVEIIEPSISNNEDKDSQEKRNHDFNYKNSLTILATSIYKDTNRIRSVQCNILIERIRSTIKEELKNVDNMLITVKCSKDCWDYILKIVNKLEDYIYTNLSKCFINLKTGINTTYLNNGDNIYARLNTNCDYGLGYFQNEQITDFSDDAGKNDDEMDTEIDQNKNDMESLFNSKKFEIITKQNKKEKYVSTINNDLNKEMNNKKLISELKKFYTEIIIDALKIKLDEISNNIANIIINRFESVFNYDEIDQPRQWRNISAIELKNIFRVSKDYAFLIIEILQKNIKIDKIDNYLSTNFINTDIIEKGKIKAKKRIQEICRDAQYIQETGGHMSLKNVPFAFWVILLILGWNEILMFTRLFFRLNIILPMLIGFIIIVISCLYTGNAQILSYINKIIFIVIKNLYNFYKHLQTIGHQTTKPEKVE
ncbi:protein SEY1, putative [Plasmodium berghei]|uniref:Protein SEY1 homolog n=2 Tax=Plasmodium berghei TaxID=5821 RepID=SEY1_PLABA|nr:protein SEY1, putative [Plasmodium berghei ANKA]A0A509AN59.1 RecName: Full=Protein SEY1 homolog; Short=PbSEY1 [Plasmodium berghei ANKA]CXI54323.1 protein SEY1, putative [Plasmodium berghei]SCL94954.1 protein SEY1, putative [Plasmodium berghei]SCM16141.1 protein SEY1, putative [Plasmodium berghei]SCM17937.1 protein SEY1, putative [Plasmodium berghei]SCN26301.1 protein SEY1, putative [Plasmodium berghei]|eukprot:XP_034422065.1 protein SEY1, putative [Plasmodium berghei ANKA]